MDMPSTFKAAALAEEPVDGAESVAKFVVTLEKDEDWFVVECPTLPGCVSQGRTKAEALKNIKEAARGWLAVEADKVRRVAAKQNVETEEVVL